MQHESFAATRFLACGELRRTADRAQQRPTAAGRGIPRGATAPPPPDVFEIHVVIHRASERLAAQYHTAQGDRGDGPQLCEMGSGGGRGE